MEPDRPVGTIGPDPRRHQSAGERLEPEPDAGDPVPLCGSPRGGPESLGERPRRIREGRLIAPPVGEQEGGRSGFLMPDASPVPAPPAGPTAHRSGDAGPVPTGLGRT